MFSLLSNSTTSFTSICNMLDVANNTPAWPDKFGIRVRNWLNQHSIAPISTLSLFSGAGGLDIGFSDVGFDIVASVEVEKNFCETLKANTGEGKYFKNSHVNCIDICNFSGEGIGHVDFIIGGPPCQTFSAAGRRANGVLGTSDARGVLFKEYARLLRKLSPKGFLFENVYGILGAQGGRAWQEVSHAFSELGYKLYHRILDAADYGVPQHRERLIVIGLKEGCFKFPRPTHGPDSIDNALQYNAETAIYGVISKESDEENKLSGRYAKLLDDIPPGLNYSFYTEEMGHPYPIFAWRSKFSDFLYKADPTRPVRTIKASGGAYTGPLHWENRFFKYEEYKRLQTFPDKYYIYGNKQIAVKQLGNAVPPQLARILAIAIREQIFKTEFPFSLPTLESYEELSFRKTKRKLTAIYRDRAASAIQQLNFKESKSPLSYTYYCKLHSNFLLEIIQDIGDFEVNIHWGKQLSISVTEKNVDKIALCIQVYPAFKWALPVDNVSLIVKATNIHAFTVAWKAFERELSINNIKDDLVQLNGYYQYAPKLKCECNFFLNVKYSNVLCDIISGKNIGVILPTTQFATAWNVNSSEISLIAHYLKELGYEIRNHSTNPQIDEGYWLIPYAFPTLNPSSVQLRKPL